MKELTISQQQYQEIEEREYAEAKREEQYGIAEGIERFNLPTKHFLIWVGNEKEAARIKISRRAERIDRGIANIQKGRIDLFSNQRIQKIRAEIGREREKLYNLASKHDLREDPNYCRYEQRSRLFLDSLRTEVESREKTTKKTFGKKLIKHAMKKCKDSVEQGPASVVDMDSLIEAMLVYFDTTIPPTYNHYSQNQTETWRLN